MKNNILRLAGFIAVCLLIGWLGGMATASSVSTWYPGLKKPLFNPPDAVFAPVWTLLYILIGVSGSRLWTAGGESNKKIKILFSAQLALNALWSFLFFGLRNPFLGLLDITLLWLTVFFLIRQAWNAERMASALLLPYFLWITFAAYLNAGLWWLNR